MTRRPGHARRRHAHAFGELDIRAKQRAQLVSWRMVDVVRCAACGTAVERHDAIRHADETCPGSKQALAYQVFARRRRP